MGIEIEHPLGYASSGNRPTLFCDTGTFLASSVSQVPNDNII